ncbi:MAG: formimidoylglutamate deiminase [Burkholderiales bacterium]|nr:formimidoylglutamate deiminase [Burkholderiales bacterium]
MSGSLHAEHALLPGGWAADVRLRWDAAGKLTEARSGVVAEPGDERAPGPLLPGIANLHSHAFQRLLAGLTEYRGASDDSFWSWREQMYHHAARLTPDALEAIATWLYVEMLEAGYTAVCEFHYLHNAPDGRPYADDAAMSRALLRAARRAGIAITLLPVLYQQGGFGAKPSGAGQQRFVRETASLLRLVETLQAEAAAQGGRCGLAPHSLRAVGPEALREVLAGIAAIDPRAPIHIHIAEQRAEVDACLAWSGQRPLAWLLDQVGIDDRWCLVHATHLDADEVRRAAASGAVAGLCPTTEANLGDGLFDLPAWGAAGGRWGIGSDSQITVDAAQELQWLEYGQRLATGRRNVAATPQQPQVAAYLVQQAVAGGAQASGRAAAGIAVGQQADLVALDAGQLALAGLAPDAMLASHVFASSRRSALADVWVGGRRLVQRGRHALHDAAAADFIACRRRLLAGA